MASSKQDATLKSPDIMELFSHGPKHEICATLTALVDKNPDILNQRFVFGRTILQMAIMKSLPETVDFILKKKIDLALVTDNKKLTILHYAVIYCTENASLVLNILSKFPELAYQVDDFGKTPLHYAVEKNFLHVVHDLPTDREIIHWEDSKHQSPLSLAKDNPEMITALTTLKIDNCRYGARKLYSLVNNELQKTAINTLNSTFPNLQLFKKETKDKRPKASDKGVQKIQESGNPKLISVETTATSEPVSTSKNSTPRTPPSISKTPSSGSAGSRLIPKTSSTPRSTTSESYSESSSEIELEAIQEARPPLNEFDLDILSKGNLQGLTNFLQNGGNPHITILGRSLLVSSFLSACHYGKKEHHQVFFELLRVARIDVKDKNGQTLFNKLEEHHAQKLQLLQEARTELHPEVIGLYNYRRERLTIYSSKFERILFHAGLNEVVTASFPKFPSSIKQYHKVTPLIWALCSLRMVDPFEEEKLKDKPTVKGFQKAYTLDVLYGVMDELSTIEMIQLFNGLYRFFNLTQRLVANFLVKELILLQTSAISETDQKQLMEELNRFKLNNSIHLHVYATHLNSFLDKLIEIQNEINEHTLIHNFSLINEFLRLTNTNPYLHSFEKLFDEAVENPSEANISKVAHEIRCTMLEYIKRIRTKEFYQAQWQKDDRKMITSPNIVLQQHMYNQLGAYLAEKILVGNEEHSIKVIKFLVLLAANLSKDNDIIGPELNSAGSILTILELSIITRLKSRFTNQDKTIMNKLEELRKLFDPVRNFEWLTQLSFAHPDALPYMTLYTKVIEKAFEGNKKIEQSAAIVGKIYRQFLGHQRASQEIPSIPTTNCFDFFINHIFMDEEGLAQLSSQIIPPLVTLNDAMNIKDIHDAVMPDVKKGFLPTILYKDSRYNNKEAVQVVVHCLYKQRKQFKNPAEKKMASVPAIELIEQMTSILKRKMKSTPYEVKPGEGLSVKQNPYFMVGKLATGHRLKDHNKTKAVDNSAGTPANPQPEATTPKPT